MITRDEFDAVRARLTAVEAECAAARRAARAWRAVAAVGLVLLAAAALDGPQREAEARAAGDVTVEANRFVLKDASGKIRGTFRMSDDGHPFLALYREDGKFAAAVGVDKGDAFVRLYDTKKGETRADLGVYGEKELPQFALLEEGKKSAVTVGWARKTGEGPAVRVYDEANKKRAAFGIARPEPTSPKPIPLVVIYDEADKPVFVTP